MSEQEGKNRLKLNFSPPLSPFFLSFLLSFLLLSFLFSLSLSFLRLPCNSNKNRYKDVICYDSTRVTLSSIPDVEVSKAL